MNGFLFFCACLVGMTVSTHCIAGETTVVIGARPWNFQPRSREHHLTMQMGGPAIMERGGASLLGGIGPGLPGYPITSNSYAIGNWIQVEMHLGDGSEGLIMIENHQTNNGDQQSVSNVLGELMSAYQQ